MPSSCLAVAQQSPSLSRHLGTERFFSLVFSSLGTVIRRWGQLGKGVDGATDIHLAIFANNLHVANNQIISQIVSEEQKEQFQSFWMRHQHNELEGRNQLLASFCPQVYGLFLVKLAVR